VPAVNFNVPKEYHELLKTMAFKEGKKFTEIWLDGLVCRAKQNGYQMKFSHDPTSGEIVKIEPRLESQTEPQVEQEKTNLTEEDFGAIKRFAEMRKISEEESAKILGFDPKLLSKPIIPDKEPVVRHTEIPVKKFPADYMSGMMQGMKLPSKAESLKAGKALIDLMKESRWKGLTKKEIARILYPDKEIEEMGLEE